MDWFWTFSGQLVGYKFAGLLCTPDGVQVARFTALFELVDKHGKYVGEMEGDRLCVDRVRRSPTPTLVDAPAGPDLRAHAPANVDSTQLPRGFDDFDLAQAT